MIRRLKRDVLDDLPPLSRISLPVDIRTVDYRKALVGLNRTNAITRIMDAWHIIGREKAKVAIEWTNDFFEQHEDETKLVLYAHHLDVIETLAEGLRSFGVAKITGKSSMDNRATAVTRFQNPGGPRVIIINKAGGEGIDLFGKRGVDASTILFVERQWVPGMEWQAEGRLDRIGQTSPVVAYYLSAIGTFDTTMAKEIESKQLVIGSTMDIEEIELDVTKDIINSLL